jgi:hypothetical protein
MKIFQIGFNRCGTSSLYDYFRKNNYKSIHWDKGNLAKMMINNYNKNKKLLNGIDDYDFYSDMEFISNNEIIEAYKFYELLDNQYPNSLFILNKRNKDRWLESRLQHPNGTSNYILRYSKFYSLTKEQVIELWRNDWDSHHKNVKEYFKEKNNFLEFNIESDSDLLFTFLNSNGLIIKNNEFSKLNKGKKIN